MDTATHWADNPWNRLKNNLDENGCNNLNVINTGFEDYAFYKIFNANDSLNCLGLAQKNYVQKMVAAVQTACDGAPCRNVLFEIMNEATYSNNQTGPPDAVLYGKWHRMVASWIRTCGNYVVTGTTGSGGASSVGSSNLSAAEKAIFDNTNIKLVSLHWGEWNQNAVGKPCEAVAKFRSRYPSKPIVIDDDGANDTLRNVRCDVYSWAFKCVSKGAGIAHYLHLDDTRDQSYACSPAATNDFRPDCNKIDILGNAGLTNLCGSTWIGTCNAPADFCPANCSIACTTSACP